MRKLILALLILFMSNICYAYTETEKQAIFKFIKSNIATEDIINPKVYLDYYLDHKDDIDVSILISQQKQEKIDSLQKKIDSQTVELNDLKNQSSGVVTP